MEKLLEISSACDHCHLVGCCGWGPLTSPAQYNVIWSCCDSSTPGWTLSLPLSVACFFSCVYMPALWSLWGGVNAFLCTRPLTSVRIKHLLDFSMSSTESIKVGLKLVVNLLLWVFSFFLSNNSLASELLQMPLCLWCSHMMFSLTCTNCIPWIWTLTPFFC